MECKIRLTLLTAISFAITSCTLNPFKTDQQLTGNPVGPAIGAAAGVGTVALLGGSKPAQFAAGGLVGGLLGYYVTTLQFTAAGITQSGGQVFTLGDYAAIEMPTDRLFEVNSSDFLEDAGPILDSAAAVLRRYPDNNIIISGNTSGFGTEKYERKLSEARAREVAAYLWAHGISETAYKYDGRRQTLVARKLTYVGYGNYFPIANNIHNDSIRQNSRIQITAYPTFAADNIKKIVKSFNGYKGEHFVSRESTVLAEQSGSRAGSFQGYNEGTINNSIIAATPHRPPPKEDDVWGNYNNPTNECQTTSGASVEKQGGFKGEV